MAQPASASSQVSGSESDKINYEELLSCPVTFSLGMLERLQIYNVQYFTVMAGREIVRPFIISPETQMAVSNIIEDLPQVVLHGEEIHIGFEDKSTLRELMSDKSGISLVLLCACLSTTYNPDVSGLVLRRLWTDRGGPHGRGPSVERWQSLVEMCSNLLCGSTFPIVVQSMVRLFPRNKCIPLARQTRMAPDPAYIAKVLLLFSDIANHKSKEVILPSRLDCAWLGACAEWLFGLHVAIRTLSGRQLYQSAGVSPVSTQVAIILDDNSPMSPVPRTMSDSVVVPERYAWIRCQESSTLPHRADWSNIFRDSFGSAFHALQMIDSGELLGHILAATAHGTQRYTTNPHALSYVVHHLWPPAFADPASRGHGFLEFVARQFPELRQSVSIHIQIWGGQRRGRSLQSLVAKTKQHCCCEECRQGSQRKSDDSRGTCLKILADTIVNYALFLSRVIIPDNVRPLTASLRALYLDLHAKAYGSTLDATHLPENRLGLALSLFSSTMARDSVAWNVSEDVCAISYGGWTAYYACLHGLNTDLTRFGSIHIAYGSITDGYSKYRLISDLALGTKDVNSRGTKSLRLNTTVLTYKLVTFPLCDERNRPILRVAYSFNTGMKSMRPARLVGMVENAVRVVPCLSLNRLHRQGKLHIQDFSHMSHSIKLTVASCPKSRQSLQLDKTRDAFSVIHWRKLRIPKRIKCFASHEPLDLSSALGPSFLVDIYQCAGPGIIAQAYTLFSEGIGDGHRLDILAPGGCLQCCLAERLKCMNAANELPTARTPLKLTLRRGHQRTSMCLSVSVQKQQSQPNPDPFIVNEVRPRIRPGLLSQIPDGRMYRERRELVSWVQQLTVEDDTKRKFTDAPALPVETTAVESDGRPPKRMRQSGSNEPEPSLEPRIDTQPTSANHRPDLTDSHGKTDEQQRLVSPNGAVHSSGSELADGEITPSTRRNRNSH